MPAFKKQHYEFVAKIMSSVQPAVDAKFAHGQWERTCLAFLNQFQSDNQQFDRDRFLKACKGDT